jgi:hypothetical protein
LFATVVANVKSLLDTAGTLEHVCQRPICGPFIYKQKIQVSPFLGSPTCQKILNLANVWKYLTLKDSSYNFMVHKKNSSFMVLNTKLVYTLQQPLLLIKQA